MKSRITRITAALLAAVLSLGLLVGCKPKKELTRYTTIFYDVFDTVTQVIAYCESEEAFNTQMQALHQDLIAYNQLYDIYNDYDGVVNVKTINENAGKAPVQVDDRILSMLELARQMYDLTGGKINIAMGSVLGIWHDYREAAEKTLLTPTTPCPHRKSWKPLPGTAISTTLSLTRMPKRSTCPTRRCRWTWAAWAKDTPWRWSAAPPKPGA